MIDWIVVAIKLGGVVHILGRAQYRSMSRHALIITINFALPYPRIIPRLTNLI